MSSECIGSGRKDNLPSSLLSSSGRSHNHIDVRQIDRRKRNKSIVYVHTEVLQEWGVQGQICYLELRIERAGAVVWDFKGEEDNSHGDEKANVW